MLFSTHAQVTFLLLGIINIGRLKKRTLNGSTFLLPIEAAAHLSGFL